MKLLIVANWKMNPQTLREAEQLFDLVKKGVKNIKKAEVVICSPFVFLSNIPARLRVAEGKSGRQHLKSNIKLGAQDVFREKEGAYTGEISSLMLKDVGCQYVIVGHSERRGYFGETNEMINKKLKAVLEEKLNPILCIGETQQQRDKGETDQILKKQIKTALKKVSSSKFSKITIAYEPIWAIGTGEPCNVEEAQKIGLLIRKIISGIYNRSVSKNLRILYGGSVNSKNAAGYIKEAGLQGLLVGGASLKAKEFVKIVKTVI